MPDRRIALVSDEVSSQALLDGSGGGLLYTYVEQISLHLAALGFDIDVVTRWENAAAPRTVQWAPNVRLVHVRSGPPKTLPKEELWRQIPAFRNALLHHMQDGSEHYDLLHSTFWTSGWVACELKERMNVPFVHTVHATDIADGRPAEAGIGPSAERSGVVQTITRLADRLIAQSHHERDRMARRYEADPAAISVIPPGVDTQRFRPMGREHARQALGLDPQGSIVAYVAPELDDGNVDAVLGAMSNLPEPHTSARLLLLRRGGDAMPAQLDGARPSNRRFSADDRIIDAGSPPNDLLWLYYGAADVVVVPGRATCSSTALEAMACGRPVISLPCGSAGADRLPGPAMTCDDAQALAENVGLILSDAVLRARVEAAGRARAEEEFAWSVIAQRTANVYEEALQGKRRPLDSQFQVETISGTAATHRSWTWTRGG